MREGSLFLIAGVFHNKQPKEFGNMSETENRITDLSPVGLAFPDHPAVPHPRRMCQGD